MSGHKLVLLMTHGTLRMQVTALLIQGGSYMYTITTTANGHQVTKTLIMYKPIKTVQNRILQKKEKKLYCRLI